MVKLIFFTGLLIVPMAGQTQFVVNTPASDDIANSMSSAADWADIDGDGDLDLVMLGADGTLLNSIYRNTGDGFEDIGAGLPGVEFGSVQWGDYDNDGDPDLLFSGYAFDGAVTKIYRNDDGAFTDIQAALPALAESALEWGDYDNDGDLDIAIVGVDDELTAHSKILRNEGGTFVDIEAALDLARSGDVAWGDLDGDEDLDLAVTGGGVDGSHTTIYRNTDGSFAGVDMALQPLNSSTASWVDFDGDGDQDLLVTGKTDPDDHGQEFYHSILYENEGGTLTDSGMVLAGVAFGTSCWGDADADGDPDLLLTGLSDTFEPVTFFYINDGGTMVETDAGLPDINFGAAVFGDYDHDRDLDIFISGYLSDFSIVSSIYENTVNPGNAPPSGLTLTNATVKQSQGEGALVGTLQAQDADAINEFTFGLVEGNGATHNDLFYLSESDLYAVDAADMKGGEYSIRVRVDDGYGGVLAKELLLTIVDDVVPVAVVQAVTLVLDANGEAKLLPEVADNGSYDPGGGAVSFSVDKVEFSCVDTGEASLVFTVEDEYQNKASMALTVTVADGLAPEVIAKNITIELDAEGKATLTAALADGGSTDNCDFTLSLDKTTFDCTNMGENTVTLAAVDASGNTASSEFTVTVADSTAPQVVTRGLTVSLNEDGLATIEASQVDDGSADNCALASLALSKSAFSCDDLGDNEVVLKGLDFSGNETEASAIVKVVDTIAPVIGVTMLEVELNDDGLAYPEFTMADLVAADNCGIASMSYTQTTPFTCENLGDNQVGFTITDLAGNTVSKEVNVVVKDLVAPVLAVANLEVMLDETNQVVVSAAQFDAGSFDNCGIAAMEVEPGIFTSDLLGENRVMVTVTDASGNQSSSEAVVTVLPAPGVALGVPAIRAESSLAVKVFPNPVQDNLQVELDMNGEGRNITFTITNLAGKIVMTKQEACYNRQAMLRVSELPRGIYLLLVSDGIGSGRSSFIKL